MDNASALVASIPELPYTFRYGKVLVTIGALATDRGMLRVDQASGTFDGGSATLDLPLYYINPPVVAWVGGLPIEDPLEAFKQMMSNTIREVK